MRTLVIVFLTALGAGAADLPVREVVLYKNGIGYFRRAGELKAGESVRLDFKAAEMNDVLKSLTVVDEGGAKVTGLRYDSADMVARKLGETPFQLGEAQPLSALLDQLIGARIELKTAAETISGTLVGARQVDGTEKQQPHGEATLLLDSGDLRVYDLGGVSTVRFADPALQLQLKDYLASTAQARAKEKRSVYIDSSDQSSRRLRATYVVPTAVWKSSYRLIFAEGEPVIEGWAIVDNTSGDDWSNVRLALVSGRPVSFISRLYDPRYVQRQLAELPEDQAAAPELHGGAVGDLGAAGTPGGVAGGAAVREFNRLEQFAARAPRPMVAAPPPPPPARAAEMPAPLLSSVSEAVGRELGELFEYRFPNAVTVRKDESAMLPFLQQRVAARKLLIYSDGSENPRNAAEITNATGKTLDGGPITVYDAGAYSGEALMETLKTGDKRLISYAVDLGTRITTAFDSTSEVVREIHVSRGILTTRAAFSQTKTYTIRNIDQKPKTLMIEHAVRPEYKLLNQKPSETTSNAYRFEVKLPAGGSQKFPVTEEQVYNRSLALSSATPDVLLVYVQNKTLSPSARTQLETIVQQKRAITANNAEIRQGEKELEDLNRDEERVRNNIASLNRVNGQQDQVQTYARQLAAHENRIVTLRDRISEMRKKGGALDAELSSLIDKLEF